MPNAINFIARVNDNAVRTFRNLATIGFVPDTGLNGNVITQYHNERASAMIEPSNITFGLKFNAMKDMKSQERVGSFMLVRSTTTPEKALDTLIPTTINAAIQEDTDFPADGHLRWRTSAPPTTGKLYGYLVNGNKRAIIDTTALGLDSDAEDVQCVFAGGYHNLSIRTARGSIYESRIKPVDLLSDKALPKFTKLKKEGITALLTVPQNGEMIAFYAQKDGLYFGNTIIPSTANLKVIDIIVDSEQPRVFIVTKDGKIAGFNLDINFMLQKDTLIQIEDVLQPGEQLFAGPAVKKGKEIALLAINWREQDNCFFYDERTIAVPLPTYPIVQTHAIRA